jgi:phosphoesterase RecJ-like protein
MPSADLVRAAEVVRSARRVWVATHRDPDGDAIGSLLGLGHVLGARGIAARLACADPVPEDFRFLPGSEAVAPTGPDPLDDVLIAADAGDLDRLGGLIDGATWSRHLSVVLDHHRSNPGFGTVNVVAPEAASTAQLVRELADELGVALTPEAATCLLAGLVTDTLGFRTSSTDERALRDAADLVRLGAPLPEIAERVFGSRPLSALRLWARAVERFEVRGRAGIASLTADDLAEVAAGPGDTKGLSSYLLTAREVDVVALVREREPGVADVSMRSRPGLDLVPLATQMGGGGHPQAAGATIAGSLEDARATLWPALATLTDGA